MNQKLAKQFQMSHFYLSGLAIKIGRKMIIGPLQLAVTWYKIRHAGEQATHWDIQNKENANLS